MDAALQRFLAGRSADFSQTIEFGDGAHRLTLRGYLTTDTPPDQLVLAGRALVLRESEVLVVQNPDGEHVLPGGRREAGESPEDSARREVLEESRLELHVEPCRVAVLFDCTRADPVEEGQGRLLWRSDDLRYGIPGPPVWSPDGRSVAVWTASGIFTANADGSGITHLVETRTSGRGYSDLAWSEDGRRILITSSYQGI